MGGQEAHTVASVVDMSTDISMTTGVVEEGVTRQEERRVRRRTYFKV